MQTFNYPYLKKNASKFKSWDDMNKSNVTIIATLGTTKNNLLKFFQMLNIEYESPARDFQDVLAGRVMLI